MVIHELIQIKFQWDEMHNRPVSGLDLSKVYLYIILHVLINIRVPGDKALICPLKGDVVPGQARKLQSRINGKHSHVFLKKRMTEYRKTDAA